MRKTLRILLSKNYRMDKVDSEISDLLNQYLIDCSLSKIAYFTNRMPTKSDSENLSAFFSYICFCTSNLSKLSSFLFNKYWARFIKVPFDVFVLPFEECVTARQYNFINLKCENLEDAERKVYFIKENKRLINRNYPILIRLNIKSGDFFDFMEKNGFNIACNLSATDIIIRIEK